MLSNLLGTDPSTLEVEEWKDQLRTGYALWGIPRAPDKSTLGFDAVTLGATLDGYRAQARLGEAKTCDYIGLTWLLLQQRCPKVKDTSMGLGRWIFSLKLRRPFMMLLQECWKVV